MKRLALAAAVLAVSGSLYSTGASAQFAKPDDAIKYRQSAFTVLTTHMGRLGAMARGDVPFDAAAAQASARVVEVVSHLPWDAFPPGSNTGAAKIKGDPWKDAAAFTKLQGDLKAQTAKLPAAVATLDGLKAQVGATSRVCRECHESFRQVR
ncbi:MAG: cytochrome c [Betaproteobacteria bacterium]|jgi:cytochrome c556|nr:cytochrome c [Betaproteobacteria bacterium]